MQYTLFYLLCSTLVPKISSYILYTLGFPIFIRGVDYTILLFFITILYYSR
nr:MAG TPA: hypothetical protein [Caudoviricetes sp.]